MKEESRKKILRSLKEKGNLMFKQLLEETELARSTLTLRLKDLLETGKIERFYNTYKITQKAIAEVQIECMIKNLGRVATHYVVRKKLNKPIDVHHDIFSEIAQWFKQDLSWKELFDYLEEKYSVTTKDW